MTVDVDFPASLPCVSRIDGFGMNAAAAVIRTPFEAGNARQRRMHAVLPQEIALAWRCSNSQLQPLISWLNTFGYDWFNLQLAGLEASELGEQSTPIAVRLMTDLQITLMQFHRENWWTVRASAEYQPPVATIVSLEEGEEVESSMLFIPLHRVTPDPEWGELVYVNIDTALSIARNVDNTGTRILGPVVDPGASEEPPAAAVQPSTVTLTHEWTLDAQIAAGPSTGRMRLNNATQAAATLAWLNYTTADGADAKAELAAVRIGATLALQNKGDAAKHVNFGITASPVDRGTYIELPLTFASEGSPLVAGQRTIVQITQESVPPPEPDPDTAGGLITVIVKETPEQIAAMVSGARRAGTRIVGAPRLSPARPASH